MWETEGKKERGDGRDGHQTVCSLGRGGKETRKSARQEKARDPQEHESL